MKRGLKYLIGIVVILGAVIFLLSQSLSSNLQFFLTPSEYLQDEAKYAGKTLRLGGTVEKGSKSFNKETLELHFNLTDGVTTTSVVYRGAVPDLFREGFGVTVQGKFEGKTFRGEELLVKHSEEYRPPKPGEKIDRKIIEDSR